LHQKHTAPFSVKSLAIREPIAPEAFMVSKWPAAENNKSGLQTQTAHPI
jgi:hypothetical protein